MNHQEQIDRVRDGRDLMGNDESPSAIAPLRLRDAYRRHGLFGRVYPATRDGLGSLHADEAALYAELGMDAPEHPNYRHMQQTGAEPV